MRETSLVTVQGKKQMCDAECISLTKEQCEKLTSREFSEKVDSIAKNCHIDWSIHDKNGMSILHVTRTTVDTIDDAFHHELEIAATNFMSAIDKLELPNEKDEPECPSHENANLTEEKRETINFVKTLLHDINLPKEDEDRVIGGQILCYGPKDIPLPLPWGKISSNLLKEMCEIYLQAYKEFDYHG